MDICVRCGACADKCHFYHRLRRSQEHAGSARRTDPLGLPPLLHPYRAAVRRPGGGAGSDRGRPQGVVLLLLPVHRMPPLLGVLPLRHRHRGNHHDRPRAAEPGGLQYQLGARAGGQLFPHRQSPGRAAARLQGQRRFRRGRARGAHRRPRGCLHQPKRRGDSLRRALRRLFRHSPHYYTLPRLPAAVPRNRPGLHLQRLRLGRRQLRPVHLARDDQAAERQDLRRGEAAGREVDPGRRVRPHVAGAAPVHGHHERSGGFPGSAGLPPHRHAFRQRPIHQDGPHLRIHRRPDPAQQAETRYRTATTTGRSPSTTPAIPPGPWGCWRSPATSCTTW